MSSLMTRIIELKERKEQEVQMWGGIHRHRRFYNSDFEICLTYQIFCKFTLTSTTHLEVLRQNRRFCAFATAINPGPEKLAFHNNASYL